MWLCIAVCMWLHLILVHHDVTLQTAVEHTIRLARNASRSNACNCRTSSYSALPALDICVTHEQTERYVRGMQVQYVSCCTTNTMGIQQYFVSLIYVPRRAVRDNGLSKI